MPFHVPLAHRLKFTAPFLSGLSVAAAGFKTHLGLCSCSWKHAPCCFDLWPPFQGGKWTEIYPQGLSVLFYVKPENNAVLYARVHLSFSTTPNADSDELSCVIFNPQRHVTIVFLWYFFRALPIIAALLCRCIKRIIRELVVSCVEIFHRLFWDNKQLELAGRYPFYRASSETSQNLNNRTLLRMSAEEECSKAVGMQPGNYSHIRQLKVQLKACNFPITTPITSPTPLLVLLGAHRCLSGRWLYTLSAHLWPLESQPVGCTWKSK